MSELARDFCSNCGQRWPHLASPIAPTGEGPKIELTPAEDAMLGRALFRSATRADAPTAERREGRATPNGALIAEGAGLLRDLVIDFPEDSRPTARRGLVWAADTIESLAADNARLEKRLEDALVDG